MTMSDFPIAPKQHLSDLVHHCVAHGLRHIVISPGSRNAPVTRAFFSSDSITCHSIVDERSAAFVALGMAQQLGEPVAVLCTSGSAPLNYGPAISESYYQRIPLLVLTADRPARLVDQQDSQTIRQGGLFANIVKASYSLPEEPDTVEGLHLSAQIIRDAFYASQYPAPGPVHINIPLEDPLYTNALSAQALVALEAIVVPSLPIQDNQDIGAVAERFWASPKKMIVCGQGSWHHELSDILHELDSDPDVVVIAENTANLGGGFIHYPDFQVLGAGQNRETLAPDTLISFGGHVVSKHLKVLLRDYPAAYHLRLDPEMRGIDTYHNLSEEWAMEPEAFFRTLLGYPRKKVVGENNFSKAWQIDIPTIADEEYQALETVLQNLPAGSIVHLGNSMTVRHAAKIETRNDLVYYSNRGVAGIDGCLSTAVGCAMATDKPVLCVLGDCSFVYDSNGLWNRALPNNLKVMVLNNCGGDIFRRLKGPSESPGFEEIFIAHHPVDMQKLVEAFGVNYLCGRASDEDMIKQLLTTDRATVLEVIIEREVARS